MTYNYYANLAMDNKRLQITALKTNSYQHKHNVTAHEFCFARYVTILNSDLLILSSKLFLSRGAEKKSAQGNC